MGFILHCIVFSCVILTLTSRSIAFQNDDFRLNKTVWPENYQMEFLMILDEVPGPGYQNFTAVGKSLIRISCSEPVTRITMHAINLSINDTMIRVQDLQNGLDIPITRVSYREDFDFIDIDLSRPTVGFQAYGVYLEFLTPIYHSTERLNGMYQDYYEDPVSGETKYIATTLFAPYHARRAFPCFDEPSFRATYDITLGHHNKYHAMSNAEIISTRPIVNMTNWQWDTFAKTPSMSSYIIAMIISDLTYEEAAPNSFRNVTVRVYATPESIAEGAGVYSANLTAAVMSFFESMFVIEYPISKLYSVALPQFFFNAMENWGLITYKEPVLLYFKNETTEEDRFRINYVLSHEKAHQYFGNIVACDWWAYVWLKEGFSTYYSYVAMEHTNPELVPWVQWNSKILYYAMNFDSTNRTHPLENFPPNSSAVADIYTAIPYQKGASILRMASSMFTEPVFLAGVKEYVRAFQYKSAVQDDVFSELQKAVDASPLVSSLVPAPVKTIMDTWTRQSGFPVLTASANSSSALQLSQRKFIGGDPSNPEQTWWVPVFISPRLNESLPKYFPDAWIPPNTTSITVSMDTQQVIIVNPWAMGYYRVLYEKKLLNRIQDALNHQHETIEPTARSVILNDYGHFVLSEDVEPETLMSVLSYLNKETDLGVWQGVDSVVRKISKLLGQTETADRFKKLIGEKAFEAFKLLKATNSNQSKDELTMLILMNLACEFGVESCIEFGFAISRLKDMARIPLTIQEPVMCAWSKYGNNDAWSEIYDQAEIRKVGSLYSPLRLRLLKALGCSENKENLSRLILDLLDPIQSFSILEKMETLKQITNSFSGTTVILQDAIQFNNILRLFQNDLDFRELIDSLASHILPNETIATLEESLDVLDDKRKLYVEAGIERIRYNQELHAKLLPKCKEALFKLY